MSVGQSQGGNCVERYIASSRRGRGETWGTNDTHIFMWERRWPQPAFIDTDKEQKCSMGMDPWIRWPACQLMDPGPSLPAGDHPWNDRILGAGPSIIPLPPDGGASWQSPPGCTSKWSLPQGPLWGLPDGEVSMQSQSPPKSVPILKSVPMPKNCQLWQEKQSKQSSQFLN